MNKNITTVATTTTEKAVLSITLEGTDFLRVKYSLRLVEVLRNEENHIVKKTPLREEFVEELFPLQETSAEEIANLRRRKKAFFILKEAGEKLYYTAIPKNLTLLGHKLLGPHMCAVVNKECGRLSPAPDRQGGCAKVRNKSKYIERYPWIKSGYETVGTLFDAFCVCECDHYQLPPPRKKIDWEKAAELKLSIARLFLGEDDPKL